MSQANRARAPQVRASRGPEFRGCLTRNGHEHFEKRTLEPRVVRMSQAKWVRSPQVRASRSTDFRGCLTRSGPEHLGNRILEPGCEDVPGESGQSTSSQGISGPRVPRMSDAKRAGTLRESHLGARSCENVPGEMGQITLRLDILLSVLRLRPLRHASP